MCQISLGQYAGVGPIKIFGRLAPAARGLGYGVVSVGMFLAFYYNVVVTHSTVLWTVTSQTILLQVSWAIWYLVASLSPALPWAHCGHPYNTPWCWSEEDSAVCRASSLVLHNNTCTSLAAACGHWGLEEAGEEACHNGSQVVGLDQLGARLSSTTEYYERHVLGNQGHSWHNFGSVRGQSVACLAAAWALVAVCLIKVGGRVVTPLTM